jgi:hypothetical protein
MVHYSQALSLRLCHYIIWSVFTNARDFFRKIWNSTRPADIPTSSLTALLGFLRHEQMGEPIGFPSYVLQPVLPPHNQEQQTNSYATTPKQDNRQYREAPIINAHYDPRIDAVLKRIQALRGDLGVKGIVALAMCDEKYGHRNKQTCTRQCMFGECTFANCRHDHSSNPTKGERTAAVEMVEKAI